MGDHARMDAQPRESVLQLGVSRLALRTEKYEDRNQDQHQGAMSQAPKTKGEGHKLTNTGGDLRCLTIGQAHGEEGAQDASAVHREGWQHIEQDEPEIEQQQL